MRALLKRTCSALLVVVLFTSCAAASAYDARPRLVVIVVVDQLREDLLERFHDRFGADGFRLLMDRGAYFDDC